MDVYDTGQSELYFVAEVRNWLLENIPRFSSVCEYQVFATVVRKNYYYAKVSRYINEFGYTAKFWLEIPNIIYEIAWSNWSLDSVVTKSIQKFYGPFYVNVEDTFTFDSKGYHGVLDVGSGKTLLQANTVEFSAMRGGLITATISGSVIYLTATPGTVHTPITRIAYYVC